MARTGVEGDAVGCTGQDFTVADDDGAERAAARGDTLAGQADGFAQKAGVGVCEAHRQIVYGSKFVLPGRLWGFLPLILC